MISYELSVLVIFIFPYLRGLSQLSHNSLDDVSPKSMEAFPLRPEKNPGFFYCSPTFCPCSFIFEMKGEKTQANNLYNFC